MPTISECLAQNLRELRRQQGLTQDELAARADLSLVFLQNLEAGRRWASSSTVTALAAALGVTEARLFATTAMPPTDAPIAPPSLDSRSAVAFIAQALGVELPATFWRNSGLRRFAVVPLSSTDEGPTVRIPVDAELERSLNRRSRQSTSPQKSQDPGPPPPDLSGIPEDILRDLEKLAASEDCDWESVRASLARLSGRRRRRQPLRPL